MPTNSTIDLNPAAATTEIYDVVVVGAGPVGLATALGLRQRGITNILVIDQARAFRPAGQVVDLLPNGLKALKYTDFTAYEAVKQKSIKISSPTPSKNQAIAGISQAQKLSKDSPEWVYKNLQGQKIRAMPLEYDTWLHKYGEGRVSIGWYDLQTTLRQLLPETMVKANHRCIDVVEELNTGCVRVDCIANSGVESNPYAHWANNRQDEPLDSELSPHRANKSIRARIVVAADGINSLVRRMLYTNSSYQAIARPEYSGFAAIGCLGITEVPDQLLVELQQKFFENSPVVTIFNDQLFTQPGGREDPSMMLIQRQNGSLGYLLHLALPLEQLQQKSGSELIDLAWQQLEQADFPAVLKQLVSLSPLANLLHRPYYIHCATLVDALPFPRTVDLHIDRNAENLQPIWSVGRVVLVGDAAHGMPPFMAQGANQGFEDALAVATSIAGVRDQQGWDDPEAITNAFLKYADLRRPLMVYIQKATLNRIHLTKAEQQEYEQQVYHRNFDYVLEALS